MIRFFKHFDVREKTRNMSLNNVQGGHYLTVRDLHINPYISIILHYIVIYGRNYIHTTANHIRSEVQNACQQDVTEGKVFNIRIL